MFWCSLTVCLDVWNLQSFECSHSIICQCCVEWKYFMFCSSELEDSFAFMIKHFCYCLVQFVSLTGYQRFVSSWTSCVCFAGLIRFCSITDIISLEFLLGHWREDINCHRWNLNLLCSSFFDLWITTSGIFQCTELFAVSPKIIIADWNFYILCLDKETATVKIKLDWLHQCCQDPISNII